MIENKLDENDMRIVDFLVNRVVVVKERNAYVYVIIGDLLVTVENDCR